MTVQLMDMDVPYSVQTAMNAEGDSFVKLSPNKAPEEHTICLGEEELDELILTLQYMKNVLNLYK